MSTLSTATEQPRSRGLPTQQREWDSPISAFQTTANPLGYAGGLSWERLRRQWEESRQGEPGNGGVSIFSKERNPTFFPTDPSITKTRFSDKFDFVIASVHSHFYLAREEMTQRVIKAIRNPYTTILGHPTGRLLLAREPYAIDMIRIIDEASPIRGRH